METSPQPVRFLDLMALQWKHFAKRQTNWLVLLVFLSAGFYGLYQGYTEKKKKAATITAFRIEKDSLLNDMKMGLVADTTTPEGKRKFEKSSSLFSGLWYTRLPSYKTPVATSIYNIGQSDVFTYYYLFAVENFEMQLLKQTEITNPLRALAGHFDVSFWIVYLLPLLVLLLSFNSLSAERDNGNWRLISSQGISEKRWLQSKLSIVAIPCFLLLLMIAIGGSILNKIVFTQAVAWSDILFFLVSVIYLFFWLSLFYFINSLRKPTTYNALVSGIAWIAVCLVIPVAISKGAELAIPVDNAGMSTFSRRPQNPQIEDSKAFAQGVINKFAAANTLYANADVDSTKPAFLLRTYHAYHSLLNEERWPVVLRYFSDVEQRQQVTNWSTIINPASSTDGILTALADNDAAAYHQFTKQTDDMHKALQAAFYPALFADRALTIGDYENLPIFQYRHYKANAILPGFFFLMTGLFFVLLLKGNRNFQKMID